MGLKDYNLLQCKLFEKYKVDMTDIVRFRQLCAEISSVREMSREEAEIIAEDIISNYQREVAG